MIRWFALIASIVVSFCLGGVYAWSAYVPALQAEHALSAAQCQTVFGVSIAAFTVVMVVAGRLLGRLPPQLLVGLGGLMLGGGYLIASTGAGSFASLLVGIGVIAGAGIGMAYVCPITVCVRWFASQRGLITGLTVCGFGAGGIGVGWCVDRMQAHGLAALDIMRWMGIAYIAIIPPAASLIAMPHGRTSDAGTDGCERVPMRELLGNRSFRVLAAGMFAGTFAGLLLIGNLRSIGQTLGTSANVAMLGLSVFAGGNAAGRIGWGWLADRCGRLCIPASLSTLALAILLQTMSAQSKTVFLAATTLCGFAFGGCFVIYAAQTTERFGVGQLAAIYPLIFLFYGISGLFGPVVGGAIFDATGSFSPAMLIASTVAGSMAIVLWRLDQPRYDVLVLQHYGKTEDCLNRIDVHPMGERSNANR